MFCWVLIVLVLRMRTCAFITPKSLGFVKSRQFSTVGSKINFLGGFKLPPRNEYYFLEKQNAHPLDAKLTFNDEAHKYSFDGKVMDKSVTQVVDSFFEQFNPDEAVRKMMEGSNWPREEYKHKNGAVFTAKEVLQKWDRIGKYARNRGTWMHYQIEKHLNNLDADMSISEMNQFLSFHNNEVLSKNIEPYRTEWRIAAPDISVGGSVDFVGKLPDGTLALFDWKRAKGLDKSLTNSFGKHAYAPVSHLYHCDGVKYGLQLNMYKYILENYYNMVVSKMSVVSFHPQISQYFLLDIPHYQVEIKDIVKHIKEQPLLGNSNVNTSSNSTSSNNSGNFGV